MSDYVGRKPMVALACFGIVGVYFAFCFVHELRHELVVGGVYGFFNGAFLSVDFSLALETMPSMEDAARWMAVWGVAGFIGTTARERACRAHAPSFTSPCSFDSSSLPCSICWSCFTLRYSLRFPGHRLFSHPFRPAPM